MDLTLLKVETVGEVGGGRSGRFSRRAVQLLLQQAPD